MLHKSLNGEWGALVYTVKAYKTYITFTGIFRMWSEVFLFFSILFNFATLVY